MKFSITDFLSQLPLPATPVWKEGVWDTEVFRHGSMSLIVFAPQGTDYQTSHNQDEVYVIVSGTGELVKESNRYSFQPGDVLFVEAGKPHHFENFSTDFRCWAIFYGPEGGEQP